MSQDIIIQRRFCGPSDSGNGGYVCGLMAGLIEGAAEVTLWRPPPLDQSLHIEQQADSGFLLKDGQDILAEAHSTVLDFEVPSPPDYERAREASRKYRGFDEHPFPQCFVCGTARPEGDGLRIFAGPISEQSIVAAPWVPEEGLAGSNGYVRPEFLWAGLDCPGCYAALEEHYQKMLLGRMAAVLTGEIEAGEPCVIIGWYISGEGRKHHTGTALFNKKSELRAKARATWIQI